MNNLILALGVSLFTFSTNFLTAQNVTVFDKSTMLPIVGVSIVANTGYGTITNEEGIFDKSFETNFTDLTLRHIGYKELIVQKENTGDSVFLTAAPIELDEVVLTNTNPKNIVLKAIENIEINYPNIPYNSFGFFRQGVTEDGNGVEMTEVNFIGYHDPSNKKNSFHASLQNGRSSENHSKFQIETSSGVVGLIEGGDLVRTKQHFLDIDKIGNYDFSFEGEIVDEQRKDESIYVISFEPVDKDDLKYLRTGKLYINKNNLAIKEIHYHFDEEKVNKLKTQSNKITKSAKPIYILQGVNVIIKYAKMNNEKWSLSFIYLKNDMQGILKEEYHDYSIRAKLIITNTTDKEVIKVKTNYSLNESFNSIIKRIDNINDWDNQSPILLSKTEKKILEDISTF